MKIAVVTNIAWNLHNFRLGLVDALKKEGHEVVLMAARDGYDEKLLEKGYWFEGLDTLERTGRNPIADLQLLSEFYKKFKRLNVEFAILYHAKPLIYGAIAAQILGIPYIATITGLAGPFSGNRPLTKKIVTLLYRFSLRKSKKVFFQNDEDLTFFIKNGIIPKELTNRVGGSGINPQKFLCCQLPNESGKHLVFLMFARLSYVKGVEYYVNAARTLKNKYPGLTFNLAGPLDNDELAVKKDTLDRWIDEGAITYLGVSDYIQNEIKQADVVVYPSYYKEGAPRSLIESAAMCRPIITTDNVGCREVVRNGYNGFLIPVRDETALEDAMLRMVHLNQNERKAMGQNGRNLVLECFDENGVFEHYLNEISAHSINSNKV